MKEANNHPPPAWKYILTGALALLAVVLGVVYLNQDREEVQDVSEEAVMVKDTTGLSHGIDSIISEFGVDLKWIKQNKPESKTFSKNIRLPKDLTLMSVNTDLTSFLNTRRLIVRTEENPRTGSLKMEIRGASDSTETVLGNIVLERSDSVKRISADVCIVLDSIERMSLEEVGELGGSGNEYSVIIPLSNDMADFQSLITGGDIEYLMELTCGGEESFDSDFRVGMSEKEMNTKIRSLYLSFPKTAAVILTDKGGSNAVRNSVEEEISGYGIRVIQDSLYSRLHFGEAKSSRLMSVIKEKCISGNRIFCIVTSMNSSELEEFSRASWTLRKKGYRFITIDEFIKKIFGNESKTSRSNEK